MWRMDKNYKALALDNAVAQEAAVAIHSRAHPLTTQPIEEPENPEHILQIFEMMDARSTLMFSSDYPHWDFDNPKMALPPLNGDSKSALCGATRRNYTAWVGARHEQIAKSLRGR
jgi:predicted TIM-barrel fold metal-dependent hydrolase